jgi:hypothetical protein
MPGTFAQTTGEKGCKAALNKAANPSEHLIDGDQFFLGSTEEKCREGAVFIAVAAKTARQDNGFSYSTLGSMLGKDATAAHRVFNDEDPSIALQALAAHLLLDKTGTLLRAMARATGRDVVDRPAMTDAEFRARVERKAKGGKADAAWLEEALEEKP